MGQGEASKYTIEVSTVDGRDKLSEISRTGTMPSVCIPEPGRLLLKTSSQVALCQLDHPATSSD